MTAIDLFAGAGGFTTGAEAAGCRVVWAANHWKAAVDVHAANHPETHHECQDLHQADWAQVPRHDLLLASPACQGHSRARGKDRPHHDVTRSTAWAVVSCAEYHRPEGILVENVTEYLRWALFPAWRLALEALGYKVTASEVDAADCGVPQHRRRVFVVATRSKAPLWLQLRRREHQPASGIVSLGGGHWTPWRTKCANTRARIENGRKAHGDRFLIAYYGNEAGGRSLDRPLGTVTTRDRYAVVDGDRMRMLSVDEYRAAMAFPSDYQLPENRRLATHLLGNAVCPPVAEQVIRALRASI
jgi:DNA (cytosine-5)-methyltransferase 1